MTRLIIKSGCRLSVRNSSRHLRRHGEGDPPRPLETNPRCRRSARNADFCQQRLDAFPVILTVEIARLNAQTPCAMTVAKPSEETVAAYVEDLRSILNEGSIMNRKAFLNSFIRRISIRDSEAEIEYTCPIGLGGNRRNEVLSMERIGSRGRARTYNITVNSRALYH